MSPRLRQLLLPQLVEQRQMADTTTNNMSPDTVDLPCIYYTANSSSSDITSPVTPIFSPHSHQRFSSSTSSLELPIYPPVECLASPSNSSGTLPTMGHLTDVQEEPASREDDTATISDNFGLYSCLCDEPCSHRRSAGAIFPGDLASDFDVEYDIGCLSDGDFTTDPVHQHRKRAVAESAFSELTTRLGSRMPTIRRWRSKKRATMRTLPITDRSSESVLSRAQSSSRSSSMSMSNHHLPNQFSEPILPIASTASMPLYSLGKDENSHHAVDVTSQEISELERDRAMTTTPLLPPLLTSPFAAPPRESPLQSPKVESCPALEGPHSPALAAPLGLALPALSTRPSIASLRNASSSSEIPLPLPIILQDHDEWSDRLGHANFTISPQPYEIDIMSTEAIAKFRNDWDLARINYTKHLVRTGENYGQTSKIYALTEAKWAEIEGRWRATFEEAVRLTCQSAPGSVSVSRTQSRARGRGRSSSSNAAALAAAPSPDDVLAELERNRIEDCVPSVVPQMLEALDADGKFPGLGDEGIVGPMQRDVVMARGRSEDAKGRFWKNLADKVGLRK